MNLMNIKILLSLTEDDSKDDILTVLASNAMSTICIYLGISELPQELNFVAEQLTVVKYRRLGAEGVSQEKIDVLSTKYTDDELLPFKDILDNFKKDTLGGKRLRML